MYLRIKEKRIKKGLTQRKLAELVGTTPATISRIESGQIATPSSELLFALDRVLGGVIEIEPEASGDWLERLALEHGYIFDDYLIEEEKIIVRKLNDQGEPEPSGLLDHKDFKRLRSSTADFFVYTLKGLLNDKAETQAPE